MKSKTPNCRGASCLSRKGNSSSGKGDSPRNIFSKKFKKNFDSINWKSKKK
tara:strand:- start:22941 stop:23093 length:153 start_codon:yes stop_codon:yes gene_type:complete